MTEKFGLGLGQFGSVFGLRVIMPRVMRDHEAEPAYSIYIRVSPKGGHLWACSTTCDASHSSHFYSDYVRGLLAIAQ